MKRIILSAIVFVFAFSSVHANTNETIKSSNNIEISNVSAFCKLIQNGRL